MTAHDEKKTKTFMDYFYAITANLHFRKKWPLSRASPKFVKCPKNDVLATREFELYPGL